MKIMKISVLEFMCSSKLNKKSSIKDGFTFSRHKELSNFTIQQKCTRKNYCSIFESSNGLIINHHQDPPPKNNK